jgi:hypothetical protein
MLNRLRYFAQFLFVGDAVVVGESFFLKTKHQKQNQKIKSIQRNDSLVYLLDLDLTTTASHQQARLYRKAFSQRPTLRPFENDVNDNRCVLPVRRPSCRDESATDTLYD